VSKEIVMAGRVLTPDGTLESGLLRISGGTIIAVEEREAYQGRIDIDAGKHLIAPGFIDLHVHGAVGHTFMSAGEDGIIEALKHHLRHGTTGILPTTSTSSGELIRHGLRSISGVIERQTREQAGELGSEILGVHVEGPYLNAKRAGAQHPEWLRNPDLQEYRGWEDLAPIRMITIAPELPGARPVIEYIRSKGDVLISAGHTDATFAEMEAAAQWGVSHCTHFGNGMRGLHHREPGVFGAGLIQTGMTVELIADGIHVHPGILDLVYRVKGADRTALITDAVAYCGLKDGVYSKGPHDKREVIVENGSVRIKGDGGLAGSCLTMNRAAKMMADLGIPLLDVWKMASSVPAGLLGLRERKGKIEPRMDADLVIMNENFDVLLTMVRGVAHQWNTW
jgi:N-acetylglucosamine-6-phosphate deacetylase